MIWIFKIDEVFWSEKPKINSYYQVDTDDINFDITKYDIDLYFPTSYYYIVKDSNRQQIYRLISNGKNPDRYLSNNNDLQNLIIEFFQEERDNKINQILNT